MNIARRRFLQSSALAPLAVAQDAKLPSPPAVDVTRKLARYVVQARAGDVPAVVRKEAALATELELAQANLEELNTQLDEIQRELNQPALEDTGKPTKRQD